MAKDPSERWNKPSQILQFPYSLPYSDELSEIPKCSKWSRWKLKNGLQIPFVPYWLLELWSRSPPQSGWRFTPWWSFSTWGDSKWIRLPDISVFCHFLVRESQITWNPATTVKYKEEVSREDLDKGTGTNGLGRRSQKDKAITFATESHEMANRNSHNRKEKMSVAISCPLFKAAHDLDVCK